MSKKGGRGEGGEGGRKRGKVVSVVCNNVLAHNDINIISA